VEAIAAGWSYGRLAELVGMDRGALHRAVKAAQARAIETSRGGRR